MTVEDFLRTAIIQLTDTGIDSARLDCLILLEDCTGRNRAYLLAHPEHILTQNDLFTLRRQVAERARHVPLAYIRGKAFFYGREFAVSEHVLVPRPETEAIIDMLKKLPLKRPRIADVGTGSGCIGITAALELPEAEVYLYDIDPLALVTARQNAEALHAVIAAAAHADLLEDVAGELDVILANLPYVPENFPVNGAVHHEPPQALYAGADGLDAYRAFWDQLAARKHVPEYVITESLALQHAKIAEMAQAAGFRLTATQGLAQQFERIER